MQYPWDVELSGLVQPQETKMGMDMGGGLPAALAPVMAQAQAPQQSSGVMSMLGQPQTQNALMEALKGLALGFMAAKASPRAAMGTAQLMTAQQQMQAKQQQAAALEKYRQDRLSSYQNLTASREKIAQMRQNRADERLDKRLTAQQNMLETRLANRRTPGGGSQLRQISLSLQVTRAQIAAIDKSISALQKQQSGLLDPKKAPGLASQLNALQTRRSELTAQYDTYRNMLLGGAAPPSQTTPPPGLGVQPPPYKVVPQ